MIITNVNTGPKADYSIDGTVLKLEVPEVGSLELDLAEKQREQNRTLNISLDRNFERLAEGVGAWYIANIVIPGKRYELVSTGETDEEGNEIQKRQELPLDISKVELHLWGFPEAVSEKIEKIKENDEEESDD